MSSQPRSSKRGRPALNEDTLGTYFVDAHGDIWKHVVYSKLPTAGLVNVDDPGQRVGGVVGSSIFEGFVPLVEDRS